MMEQEKIVAAIVAAAGGQMTGRVRLQKTFYLLKQLGLKTQFEFEYHHYGPYSRDLDNATADASASDLLKEEYSFRSMDGARYSVFTSTYVSDDDIFSGVGKDRVKTLLAKLSGINVTILELASTIHWLWFHEKISDWRREVAVRKPVKVGGGRLGRAIDLLRELDISPPETLR